MNTYMVEVNAKYLVKIQIEGSCLAAEHFFLDGFKHCWAANAYDEKGMKTECFRGSLLTSEIVSLRELESLMNEVERSGNELETLTKEVARLDKRVEELRQQYDDAKAASISKKDELEAKQREFDRQFNEISGRKM